MNSIIVLIIVTAWFGLGATILLIQINRKKTSEEEDGVDQVIERHKIEYMHRRMEAKEQEGRIIAQDLHDRLGGKLSTIKLYFGTIEAKLDQIRAENLEHCHEANRLLDEACDEIREMAHKIQHGFLRESSLSFQIRELVNIANQLGFTDVEFLQHGYRRGLPYQVETNIYRIIQELVANSLKHAFATKLTVQLNQFEDIVNVIVEDNGVGFNPMEPDNNRNTGLKGVMRLVEMLDGTINVDAKKGRGTTISMDLSYRFLLNKKHERVQEGIQKLCIL